MKKIFLFALITFFGFNSYAQIKFEKGYFILENGDSTHCFIKNTEWAYTPSEFRYKMTEEGDFKTGSMKNIKEFGIANQFLFRRYTVKMDRASELTDDMSTVEHPEFKEVTLFLEMLVKGKANLYMFETQKLTRFFYSVDNGNAEQLVFKEYLTPTLNIAKNEKYKQQIWVDLKCEKVSMAEAEKLEYKKLSLIRYFVKYNNCNNSTATNFQENKAKGKLNINVKPGVQYSSLEIRNYFTPQVVDFGGKVTARLGFELEYLFPFNKKKWAVFAEPSLRYFTAEETSGPQKFEVKYSSVELPFGIRHYFFINDNSRMFVNASYIFDIEFKNAAMTITPGATYKVRTQPTLAFGLGYSHNNKYSLEARYGTVRNILSIAPFWKADFNNFSFVFGYRIL